MPYPTVILPLNLPVAQFFLLMMHLSRMRAKSSCGCSAIWVCGRPRSFCTGSSIMPKENPDVPELVRGKAARVFGDMITLLTLMKNNRWLTTKITKKIKKPFDVVDTVTGSLLAFADMLPNLIPNKEKYACCDHERRIIHATATDLADYLVRKGFSLPRRA